MAKARPKIGTADSFIVVSDLSMPPLPKREDQRSSTPPHAETDLPARSDPPAAPTSGPSSAGAPRPRLDPSVVDWRSLRQAATQVAQRAYAPYSKLHVGAAGLTEDGRIVAGCNVENASYGLTLCAECSMISALHASGGGRLVAVSCVDGAGSPLTPCGRCRQLLHEHGGPQLLVDGSPPRSMAELLPGAFTPDDLPK